MGVKAGLGFVWEKDRNWAGMGPGTGWQWGQSWGVVVPVSGATHAVGDPRGFVVLPTAKGEENPS